MRCDGIARLAAVCALAAPLIGGLEAQGAPKRTAPGLDVHNGVYAVDVTTDEGDCDKTYHGTVTIVDGRVTSTGDAGAQAFGIIDEEGVVSLSFRRGEHSAHASGKFKGVHGQGTWSSGSLYCGGRWRAERRGPA